MIHYIHTNERVPSTPLDGYSLFYIRPFILEKIMQTDKPFKTIDEQMELLKSRNLTFENPDTVRSSLIKYGYYEIINGYKDKFLINPNNDDEGFKDGITFEHILALYKLDKNIRASLKNSLEEFELSFKQILAYTIAEEYSDNDSRYIATSHYNTGKSHIIYRHRRPLHDRQGNIVTENDRDRLLKKLKYITKHNDYQPFKHYREDHHNVPPWIAIKGLMFGEAIYLYKLSKPNVRDKVLGRMINIDSRLVPVADDRFKIRQSFGDILSLCLYYRNESSHGGRIYNRRSHKYQLRDSSYFFPNIIDVTRSQFLKGHGRSSVGALLSCLWSINSSDCYSTLQTWLSVYMDQYLTIYPQDKEMLYDSMELNFQHSEVLEVNHNNKP